VFLSEMVGPQLLLWLSTWSVRHVGWLRSPVQLPVSEDVLFSFASYCSYVLNFLFSLLAVSNCRKCEEFDRLATTCYIITNFSWYTIFHIRVLNVYLQVDHDHIHLANQNSVFRRSISHKLSCSDLYSNYSGSI
jgi:hypothetical protein